MTYDEVSQALIDKKYDLAQHEMMVQIQIKLMQKLHIEIARLKKLRSEFKIVRATGDEQTQP